MIGKPYSGKLNVRFDEGELEIERQLLRQLSTLPILRFGGYGQRGSLRTGVGMVVAEGDGGKP